MERKYDNRGWSTKVTKLDTSNIPVLITSGRYKTSVRNLLVTTFDTTKAAQEISGSNAQSFYEYELRDQQEAIIGINIIPHLNTGKLQLGLRYESLDGKPPEPIAYNRRFERSGYPFRQEDKFYPGGNILIDNPQALEHLEQNVFAPPFPTYLPDLFEVTKRASKVLQEQKLISENLAAMIRLTNPNANPNDLIRIETVYPFIMLGDALLHHTKMSSASRLTAPQESTRLEGHHLLELSPNKFTPRRRFLLHVLKEGYQMFEYVIQQIIPLPDAVQEFVDLTYEAVQQKYHPNQSTHQDLINAAVAASNRVRPSELI